MRVAAATPSRPPAPNPTREAVRAMRWAKSKTSSVVVGQGNYSVDAERVPRVGMNVLMVQERQLRARSLRVLNLHPVRPVELSRRLLI